jgi:Zn-dependent peptidase ImmA (M78 family)
MAVIRRYDLRRGATRDSDISFIDSPEKLHGFAQKKGLRTVPFDIEGVVNALGIEIRKESLKDDLSGVLRKNLENNKWEMLINAKHHPNRQRYTIAHELGHYCLHQHFQTEFEDKIFFRGGENNKEEMQANSFASELLIPENDFRKMVREGKDKIDELAQEFRVSTLALRIRAKNLGMSGHGL